MKASLFRRLWQPLKVLVSRAWGPRSVGGFIRGDGEFLANTRMGNSTIVFARERLMVGDHVFVADHSVLDATHGLTIGEGCQLSYFTVVLTHSSHAAIRLYGRSYVKTPEKRFYMNAPVEIGAYSFVGVHSTILPGTRIGRGSIVTAHSMVKGGVYPDFSILKGNPAKVVGDTRTTDARLLEECPELLVHYEQWAGRGALAGISEAGPCASTKGVQA